MMKIVTTEEVKIHVFWQAWWIFGKNVTYDDIKWLKNKALHALQTVHFLKYILSVKVWIFLNFFVF